MTDPATAFNDCTGDLNFGAVNIQDPVVPIDQRSGLTKEIKVVNKGNAPMTVTAAVLNNGNPDFIISGVQQGDVLIPLPVTLDPGVGECGAPAEGNHELVITVFYSPTALGADADTLVVLTDAIEGATLELPLTGAGSDIGILLTPPTLAFGDVAEGDTAEKELIVSNLGTNDAAVNSTCIDLEDDGTCDADCTGADDDTVLDGALKCRVFKMNGDNEGKGFILLPTDAQEGGNDERRLVVTWSPVAGNATIPAGAVLRLETAILNNRVWTARILGGSAGNLVVTAPDAAACPGSFCVQAAGDPADVMTWSGSMTLHFANDGMATLDITSLEWEGPGTIADDFQLLDGPGGDAIDMDAPGITLGPGQSIDLTLEYLNNDFSGQDLINLIVNHTGLNLRDTVPIGVAPPPQP